jgi:hypothetical protein
MIFLPVLIFESAFNADWHIFRKQFGQIFILSFPCVCCGAILIMIALKVVVGYYDDVKINIFRHITLGRQHFCLVQFFHVQIQLLLLHY